VLRRGWSVVIAVGLVPLGFAIGVLGTFVHSATIRPLGLPLPVGLAVALASEAALLLAGGAALGNRWGTAIPALTWTLTVLMFTLPRPEGDLIVAANLLGYAFLLLGTVLAGLVVSLVPLVTADQRDAARAGPPVVSGR
jgi:Family of unknown function (DUF6113)